MSPTDDLPRRASDPGCEEYEAAARLLAFGPTSEFPGLYEDGADSLLDLLQAELLTRDELSRIFTNIRRVRSMLLVRRDVFSGGRADLDAAARLRKLMAEHLRSLPDDVTRSAIARSPRE